VFTVLSQLLAAFKRSTDAIARVRSSDAKGSPLKERRSKGLSGDGGSVKLALANAMATRRETTMPVDGTASGSEDSDSDWDDH
jgi:hypothetical protein